MGFISDSAGVLPARDCRTRRAAESDVAGDQAAEPGSVFSIRPIEPGAGGAGQVTQDVVLGR